MFLDKLANIETTQPISKGLLAIKPPNQRFNYTIRGRYFEYDESSSNNGSNNNDESKDKSSSSSGSDDDDNGDDSDAQQNTTPNEEEDESVDDFEQANPL